MTRWTEICPLDRLEVDRGAAALVAGDQVALFRLHSGEIYATANRDPSSGAQVMSRGLLGDRAGEDKVASPITKKTWSLRDGRSLDGDGPTLAVYPVRVEAGAVWVGSHA